MIGVGAVVESISSLKVLGPLLTQFGSGKVPVVVLMPAWRKGKPYDGVTEDMVREAFPGVVQVITYADGQLSTVVTKADLQDVVLLNPYRNFAEETVQMAAGGVRVWGLDYFANSVYVAATASEDRRLLEQVLESLSGRLVTSTWWRDLEFAVVPEHRRWAEKFVSLGTPLVDGLQDIDRERARQQLGLDPGKPVVAVFTPNIRDHQRHFFYGLGTKYKLTRLARLWRAYCDARGYQLVVKSREKQWEAAPFRAVADVTLDDLPGVVYPSTSALLLATSSLAVHFGSMMVMEAAAVGVPTIGFGVEAIDKLHGYMRPQPRVLLAERILRKQPEGLFSYKNVAEQLPIFVATEAFEETADRMIGSEDYAQGAYQGYTAKFCGWRSGEASATERVFEHITGADSAAGGAQSDAELGVAAQISSAR